MSKREFGQLLTEGIRHICTRENKQMQVVEDELGYAVGRSGSSAIRYWRQGHWPADSSSVEVLAREIVQRGRLGRTWLERFLRGADYPDPYALCDEIFPNYRPHHLPIPPTPLIGREGDVATLVSQLKDSQIRLLTLTGAPGVGKTRLALQVAAELRRDFEDGIAYVRLSPIRDVELLGITVAGALGLIENDDQTLQARLLTFLQDRNLLLVLDNFEQIITAAPRVAGLLSTAPRLKVLVTSREPLHVYGEHEYLVSPLKLPDLEDYARSEALLDFPSVQLFVERAQAVNPYFRLSADNAEAVAVICARLDGLPLAIELAASRSKWLTPQKILEPLSDRLTFLVGGPRDRPARQQTLQAAIDWSYELLTESEQKLFRQLGVFQGGWTIEAAEVICDPADVSAGTANVSQMAQALESLGNKNLIQRVPLRTASEQVRYTMLETVREYAYRQMQILGELEEIQRRHRDWCVALAERAEKNLRGPDQVNWLNQLEQETHNFRAALTWCLAHPAEAEPGLRLAGALHWFWHLHSHFSEGCDWLDKMLALAIESVAPLSTRRAQAKALCAAAQLHLLEGHRSQANALGEAGLALSQEIGDLGCIVFALATPTLISDRPAADVRRIVSLAEEVLPACRAADNQFGVAELLDNIIAPAAVMQGDCPRAITLHEEALALRRSLGDVDGIGWSLFLLAELVQVCADAARAQDLYEESSALWQQVGNRRMYANALNGLGQLALKQERYFQAQALFEESLAVHEGFGDRYRAALAQCALATVACKRHDAELAQAHLKQLAATVQRLNQPLLIADYFVIAAEIAYAAGAWERVARLMGVTRAALERSDSRRRTAERRKYDEMLTATRVALGEEVFERACVDGQRMALEAAIAYALDGATDSTRL